MKVPNEDRKFGAAGDYIYARINGRDALLTEKEAYIALLRAAKNTEDVPGVWARLKAWLGRPGRA